jgi:general secretion pathway protein D
MNPIRTGFTDGSQSTALINKFNIFPFLFGSQTPFGSDVAIDISLTINALSQNTRTEMISAPKIIALADYPAQARLTKSYWFPDSWSDLKVETTTSDSQTTFEITRPVPEFEEQELGIFLNVTPSITETGTISLNLDMKVLGRNGNDEYTFSLTGTVNGRSVSSNFTIWKPVITTRQVKTNIDVYDGQTVVVGGATDNRTNVRSDKIPFLGELPLIGRLFQAQSQKAERRNMLIFVTARLLGTDGAPVNGLGKNGAPDFNR